MELSSYGSFKQRETGRGGGGGCSRLSTLAWHESRANQPVYPRTENLEMFHWIGSRQVSCKEHTHVQLLLLMENLENKARLNRDVYIDVQQKRYTYTVYIYSFCHNRIVMFYDLILLWVASGVLKQQLLRYTHFHNFLEFFK